MSATLVLNADNSLLAIQPWTKAHAKVTKEKAIVMEEYEDKRLQSWNDAMYAPAVIKMLYFVKPAQKKHDRTVTFSRKNVWLRDKGICQYCGKFLTLDDMHWDHIMPQARGGKSTWLNLVCCCLSCNNKKDCKTPEEAGMVLRRKPFAPKQMTTLQESVLMKLMSFKNFPHESWQSYIYWNIALDS